MAFDLSTLEKRFEHVPQEILQFEEKHQAIVDQLISTAKSILDVIPYGNEAEQVITELVKVAQIAHSAIDKIPHPGTVLVGGKVVQEPVVEPRTGAPARLDTPELSFNDIEPSPVALSPTVETGGPVSEPLGTAASAPLDPTPAPAAVLAGAVSEPETKLEHIEHEIEDFLHVGSHVAEDTSVVLGDAADVVAADPTL